MKALIVCVSVAHGNTSKVAMAMAEVLGARVVEPEEVDVSSLAEYDLVGFGSGIYGMSFHSRLRDFLGRLPPAEATKAFVFATSGSRELPFWPYSRRMTRLLTAKGFVVVGTFSCRGFDTFGPLRFIGGINRGRPNEADLDRAKEFAADLKQRVAANDGSG